MMYKTLQHNKQIENNRKKNHTAIKLHEIQDLITNNIFIEYSIETVLGNYKYNKK